MPSTVKVICDDTFYNCDNISDIYFDGSKEEFESVYCLQESDAEYVYKLDYKEEVLDYCSKLTNLDKLEDYLPENCTIHYNSTW